MTTDKDNLVYKAKLAEQAERYDGKAMNRPRSMQSLFPYAGLGLSWEGSHEFLQIFFFSYV